MNKLSVLKIGLLLGIGLLSGVLYITSEERDIILAKSMTPCENPLTYRFGEIDTRFGITEEEVKQAMNSASTLWANAMDRPLAVFDEEGDVIINLVYDNRQEMVDGELRFRGRIQSEQTLTDQLQDEYDRKKREFDQQSEKYVELARRTTAKLNELNRWVREKNESGGIREDELENFEQQKTEVEQMQTEVLRGRESLDRQANEINRLSDRLNRRIDDKNKLIDEYNEEFAGENRFAKATFQRVGDGGVITVNQFMSKSELPLLMAHELGHALGLDHVSNPRSVMHGQMGGQQIDPIVHLTNEDQEAIQSRCS
ncbi:MAG: matrixin family metalloprotease [Balneolaceae bacterium]